MDYYDILGLSKGATDQDIKKAYRKLAMKWHPDKNKTNEKESRERFQEIAEAYDVLCDPEKKAIYDQYGYDGLKNGIPDENGDMREGYCFNQNASEIFNNFFGTSNPFSDFGFGDTMPFASSLRKNKTEKAPALEAEVFTTLDEIYNGSMKQVTIQRTRKCNKEWITEKKTFHLHLKPEWKSGTKVTYDKEGNEMKEYELPGDLIFNIQVKPHPLYKREGDDLIYCAKIKLADALADCVVEIPTLDGRKIPITCNEVITPTSEKRVQQEGFPSEKNKRGNLRIQFDIQFPKYLTDLQKKNLVKLLK